MELLIEALKKPQNERAQYWDQAQNILQEYFPNYENIKNLYIVQNIGIEFVDELRYVIQAGQIGTKYYIILKGNVSVLEPYNSIETIRKHAEFQIQKRNQMEYFNDLFNKHKAQARKINQKMEDTIRQQHHCLLMESYQDEQIKNPKNDSLHDMMVKWQRAIPESEYHDFLMNGIIKYIVFRFPSVTSIQNEQETTKLPIFKMEQQYQLVHLILHKSKKFDNILLTIKKLQHYLVNYYKRENYHEVATLGKNRAFGEQSLITGKPVNSTIICNSPCIFATINKQQYMEDLGNKKKQQLKEMVQFLQNSPFFKDWNRYSLVKLQQFFQKQTYKNGGFVYKKDQPCQYVYIVYKGEFLQSFPQTFYQKQNEINKYLNPQWPDIKPPKRASSSLHNQRVKVDINCSIIGRGQMFGEEDSGLHSKSVKCISDGGILLALTVQEYDKKIRANLDSYMHINQTIAFKKTKQKEKLEINQKMFVKTEKQLQEDRAQIQYRQLQKKTIEISRKEYVRPQTRQIIRRSNVSSAAQSRCVSGLRSATPNIRLLRQECLYQQCK